MDEGQAVWSSLSEVCLNRGHLRIFHQMGRHIQDVECHHIFSLTWVTFVDLSHIPLLFLIFLTLHVYFMRSLTTLGSLLFKDDFVLYFASSPLSFYLLCVIAAVSPVGIPPPAWEKWYQARSSRTQILQVG